MASYTIHILPENRFITIKEGKNLKEALSDHGILLESPCGGRGSCGKCKVWSIGTKGSEELSACQCTVLCDMTIVIPEAGSAQIITEGIASPVKTDKGIRGLLAAIDIGTTTVVCYLLDATGSELAVSSMLNPQNYFGGDVVTRIQAAMNGKMSELTQIIRDGLTRLIIEVCEKAGEEPSQVERLSIVGNPCMQQLFLGILPENLARVPFSSVLKNFRLVPAGDYLPIIPRAQLQIIPDISGFVGADTMACILATEVYKRSTPFLLVDIGTNGEMVMGDGKRMLACSTAAGPALEGANIHFGMRGQSGAVDRVEWEDGKLRIHTIGGTPAQGICGSGLIDIVAVLLRLKAVNFRGRLSSAEKMPDLAGYLGEENGERVFYLTDKVYLTQNDIRQLQLAKGAVAAGVTLMAQRLDIHISDVQEVIMAGAFGSFIHAESACIIGLLPPSLLPKIRPAGNAAGYGAKRLVCSTREQMLTDEMMSRVEFLELASLPEFQNCFARNINFQKNFYI